MWLHLKLTSACPYLIPFFHAEVMENAYNYFDSWGGKEISKAGFKASETADSIYETRAQQVNVINLNPFT